MRDLPDARSCRKSRLVHWPSRVLQVLDALHRLDLDPVAGNRIAVDRTEFGAGDAALVEVPGSDLPVHVRRRPDGTFAALSTRCMHQGCQVDRAGDRFICPCHGSEYSIEGEVLKGPTERPLLRYRTSADDKRVYVHLDTPLPPGTLS